MEQVIGIFESMAEHGTAPEEGCSLFGVGYEDAFERLSQTYLVRRFGQGSSAEKFVIGPFGSGKTHFINQIAEIARSKNCVTAKVVLNKDIDFTKSLIVYQEIAREIKSPISNHHGIKNLLEDCVYSIRSKAPSQEFSEDLVRGWISGIDSVDFKLDTFGLVAKKALMAHLEKDETLFSSACRWLSGSVDDRTLAKELGVSLVTSSEQNLFANRAMLSLFQFIKHSGFQGTVICFDEAEQGFTVDKKKTEKILSMIMAGINRITELRQGSAFLIYAITPDLVAKMETFSALQQRIADPYVGGGFFDGNTLAPVIDLSKRADPYKDLNAIGKSLVELFYKAVGDKLAIDKEAILQEIMQKAEEIVNQDISISNRRIMIKSTCTYLLGILDCGSLEAAACEEGEV